MYEKAVFLTRTGVEKITSVACSSSFIIIQLHFFCQLNNEVYV